MVSVLRSQCPLCCASSRICSPSYAPRGAPIPCGLTRLRILPVTMGGAPTTHQFSPYASFRIQSSCSASVANAMAQPDRPVGSQSNPERCNRDA